jgi:hypothetical protein
MKKYITGTLWAGSVIIAGLIGYFSGRTLEKINLLNSINPSSPADIQDFKRELNPGYNALELEVENVESFRANDKFLFRGTYQGDLYQLGIVPSEKPNKWKINLSKENSKEHIH